jgi:hypothetical protein
MTIPEILKELEPYTGRFPKKAMQAAIEQHEAITPELLRVLEAVADDPAGWAKRDNYMLHVFALFLLAQFREKRAYPLAVRIFGAPEEIPFDLYGDTVTEGLSRIFGSVFDGNPALLTGLVESEEVNEYVRTAAIDAFLVLEHAGQMPRDEVIGYFRSLFHGRLKRSCSHAWNGLVCAVADLPAPELLEDVRQAYAEDLVDPGFANLEGIERNLAAPPPWKREQYTIITDAIAEMEWWASFDPKERRPKKVPDLEIPPLSAGPVDYAAPEPVRGGPKIGRNDPCPCGSGKKYKKCCGKG